MDSRAKQRITGAVILVAAFVLLVPELLTGPGDRSARKARRRARPTKRGCAATQSISTRPRARRRPHRRRRPRWNCPRLRPRRPWRCPGKRRGIRANAPHPSRRRIRAPGCRRAHGNGAGAADVGDAPPTTPARRPRRRPAPRAEPAAARRRFRAGSVCGPARQLLAAATMRTAWFAR